MPALLNGPIVPLSFPLNDAFTVGAPFSVAGLATPLTQLPFRMIWGDGAVSTRLSISPLWMVIELSVNVAPPICTVGPLLALLVSTMAQAAKRTVSRPNRANPIEILLYIKRPFNISSMLDGE